MICPLKYSEMEHGFPWIDASINKTSYSQHK